MRLTATALAVGLCACSFAPEKPDMALPLPPPKPPAAAALQAATIPGEAVLAQRPPIPLLKAFDAPVPTVLTLSNGLQLYIVARPSAGLEAVAFVTRQGAATDPVGKEGLASLAAEMLEAGSAGKSQSEIAAAADALGADLNVSASTDELGVALSALAPQLAGMSTLLADVALRPNLTAKDWQKVQAQRLAELTAARSQPRVAARAAFRAALYGSGPLGHLPEGTLAAVKKLRLADVKAFLGSISPSDSAIIAVGSASTDSVRAAMEAAFGSWKPKVVSAARLRANVAAPSRPRFVLVDFPTKPQSVLLVGQPAVPRSSPDVLPLGLANAIIGGSFTSRLNQNLREQHGYSYGAGSSFSFGMGPGPFAASTSVQTDVTGKAVVEIFRELNRLVAEPLSQEELNKGKALLAFQLVERLESVSATVGAVADIFLFGLPLDEYKTYVSRLEALTPAAVQDAVRRTLHPDQMTLAIAGDAQVVLPQLQAETALGLPPPQRRDAEGNLVTATRTSVTSRTTPHP
jgi:zinc protease